MDFLLLIIARAAQIILIPILLIWGLIRSIQLGETAKWSKDMAIGIDRFGNCMGKYTFNDVLGKGYGDSKETISSRLGKNERDNDLKHLGFPISKKLNKWDKDHCLRAIDILVKDESIK